MQKIVLVLGMFLLSLCSVSCTDSSDSALDEADVGDTILFEDEEYNDSTVRLSSESVSFEIMPLEEIQVKDENIYTDTTKIIVSVENIGDSSEILIFLYDSAHSVDIAEDFILSATLTPENQKVEFTNLTSANLYRVGAIINGEEMVTLAITAK